MNHLILNVIFATLTFSLISNSQGIQNPNVKVLLTEKGLDYAASVAADTMAKEVEDMTIEDFSGRDRIAGGRVEYTVKEIKAYDFRKPTADVSMRPGSGVTVHFRNAAISARGNWRYSLRTLFRIRDSGSVTATTNGISISLSVAISADTSGKPTLHASACSCNISNLRIETRGGASWLYNLLLKMFKGKIESSLETGLCRAAIRAINQNGNRHLETLNLQARVHEGLVLDYSLTAPPTFTSNHVEAALKGAFVADATTSTVSVSEAPSSHMVGISISQELFNSAGRLAFQKGFLNREIELDMIKQHLVNLDEDTFSDSRIYAELTLLSAPTVFIDTDLLNVSVAMKALVKASRPSADDINLITLEISADVGVNVFVRDERLRGALKGVVPKAIVKISEVGEVETDFVEEVMREAIRLMSPSINETMDEGIPLPSIKDTLLPQAELKLLPGHISVATNVHYTP